MSALVSETKHVPADHSSARHAVYARALDELYRPRPARVFCPLDRKDGLYDVAAQTIGADLPITYLEFGVHKGWSFTRMAHRFQHPRTKLFGFDSFVGLPEAWGNTMGQGHFSTGGEVPQTPDARARFIKGWFQNTVPGFLSSNHIAGPTLVHFDADLYSSTLFLLTTLWHHVPEYHFIFDEFQPDEIVAMYDFTRAYPVEFEFIACTQDEHERPQQVFGQMRRVPFELR